MDPYDSLGTLEVVGSDSKLCNPRQLRANYGEASKEYLHEYLYSLLRWILDSLEGSESLCVHVG